MRFRIIKSALTDALSHVSKMTSQKSPISILSGIKVTADEQGLLLLGSNSDISLQVRIFKSKEEEQQVFVEQEGSVVLPGKVLGDIVRKLPDQDISWSVNENFQTRICSGQVEFDLHGSNPDEYPEQTQIWTGSSFRIEASRLKGLIRQAVLAASSNETDKVYSGVLLQVKDKILTLTATDTHRLSRQRELLDVDQHFELENVIIPGKSVTELVKILADDLGDVEVWVTKNLLRMKTLELEFCSRLLSGVYPETRGAFPDSSSMEVLVSTRELLQAVDRASLISRERGEEDGVVRCVVKDGKMTISSMVEGVGSVLEEVEAEVEGAQELKLAFNPRFILEALRTIESERLRIRFKDKITPAVITPVDERDSTHLISPTLTR